MKRIRVTVTQDDIDGAEARQAFQCPIARSLGRLGYNHAGVSGARWGYLSEGRRAVGLDYRLSRAARTFVHRFDYGMPVVPATFYLEGPSA